MNAGQRRCPHPENVDMQAPVVLGPYPRDEEAQEVSPPQATFDASVHRSISGGGGTWEPRDGDSRRPAPSQALHHSRIQRNGLSRKILHR